MSEALKDFSVTHGGIRRVFHPDLGVPINGQTAIRYIRFMRPVRIDRLELGRSVYGRWVPNVPNHPAHLIVSTLDPQTHGWKTVREVNLPPDPRISGQGLSQEMSVEEMNAHFERVLKDPPYVIDMDGLRSDHLRVECDREHPVWPNHGEMNGNRFSVPFGILEPLRAYGEAESENIAQAPYNPILKTGRIKPEAPKGMRVRDLPQMILFEGKYLSIGFSIRRPLLMHLGWDANGWGQAGCNRLLASRRHKEGPKVIDFLGGLSGPLVRTLTVDSAAQIWTGEVSIVGNKVSYRNLRGFDGLTIDAVFTVEPKRITIELTQKCEKDLPVVEAEAWRLAFDLSVGITGVAGKPTLKPGRNGDVHLPALLASDGVGCLFCRMLEGEKQQTRFQVESYRFMNAVTCGFILAPRQKIDECLTLPRGTKHAIFELAVTNLEPKRSKGSPKMSRGIRKHWGTVFSCFRPEYGGFSDHSASVNCHVAQCEPTEVIAFTKHLRGGPHLLDLARYTMGRAIMDGSGAEYWRNLYLDSDPVLISAAGRIHQVEPDVKWLRAIKPGLIQTVNRMADTIGKDGLVVCKDLSGNSGSYRWSSNTMDVVGFGHIDAYVNAWTYRAFRNVAAMTADLGLGDLAERCRSLAEGIRASYADHLLNPETGWVAGWRSRDGELHDYAFTWVNGVAIAFGLLDAEPAKEALTRLERLREKVYPSQAWMGIPCNLIPIRPEDHMLLKIFGETQPTFEIYTDGSLSGHSSIYYLRALSIYGLKDRARKLAQELDEGYAADVFNGGNGSGHEFHSWEGLPTGYEGTMINVFGPLYSIAIEFGLFTPPEPEWWPEEG